MLAAPGPLAQVASPADEPGAFIEDFRRWTDIAGIERLARRSRLPAIAAALLSSPVVRFYHDHVLVKEGGTSQRTPWHQDLPYYNVDGPGVSAWIPVDPVPEEGSLQLVAASHLGPWRMPRTFLAHEAKWFPEGTLAELPDIDAAPERFDIRRWRLEPGDAVFFDFLTIHGAPGFPFPGRRRVLSLRYLAEHAHHAPRPWRTSPPFEGLDQELAPGAVMDHPLFPVVWPPPPLTPRSRRPSVAIRTRRVISKRDETAPSRPGLIPDDVTGGDGDEVRSEARSARSRPAHRPRLAVVYHPWSVPPFEIAEAARSFCDLIWVLDLTDVAMVSLRPLLQRLGTIIDTAGCDDDEVARSLAPLQPDGIITFAEQMTLTASLARQLGLRFHSPEAAARLDNKHLQRLALEAAGVSGPASTAFGSELSRTERSALAGRIRYPVVLKPQRGTGSRATYLITSAGQLLGLLDEVVTDAGGVVAEEVLEEAQPRGAQRFSDVVGVDSVVSDGVFTHRAVTGHFSMAEPFRSTGAFLPGHHDDTVVAAVVNMAERAARAVGIDNGCINTDIVLTAEGPRIVEINGRVGGQVPTLLHLQGAPPILPLAMRLALGGQGVEHQPQPFDRVAFHLMYQAPMGATRLLALTGLDKVALLPGITDVVPNHRAGDDLDWRRGTIDRLFTVLGTADDHGQLHELEGRIKSAVTVSYGVSDAP